MEFRTAGGQPPMTLEQYWRLFLAQYWRLFLESCSDDFMRSPDGLVLRFDLNFRIEPHPADLPFDPPWLFPRNDPQPLNLVKYVFFYHCTPVAEIEVVEVRRQLTVPVPRPGPDGYRISAQAFHLAVLLNHREDPGSDPKQALEAFLAAAGIGVDSEPEM